MFTGIITDIGRIGAIKEDAGLQITVETDLATEEVRIGASIATSGICLTATAKGSGWYQADISAASLAVTTAGGWRAGDKVNLERSLRIGDELGGHIVFGHVDAVGVILAIEPAVESHRIEVGIPAALGPLVAVKGSIAVDGISLTVNEAKDDRFAVNIIPHTWHATTLKDRRPGDRVNIEVDMLSRYVARQLAFRLKV